jgi:hypothetical protein
MVVIQLMFWLKNADLRDFGSMISIQPFSSQLQHLKRHGRLSQVVLSGLQATWRQSIKYIAKFKIFQTNLEA